MASNRCCMPGLNSGCEKMNRSLLRTPLSTRSPASNGSIIKGAVPAAGSAETMLSVLTPPGQNTDVPMVVSSSSMRRASMMPTAANLVAV